MEIPEEIMKKARKVRDAYNADPDWFLAHTAIRHIAHAIQAQDQEARKSERERCAEIARGHFEEDILLGSDTARLIESAILERTD